MPPGAFESAKPRGFASHPAARPGFAALMSKGKSYEAPKVGFFADLARYEAAQAVEEAVVGSKSANKPNKPLARAKRSNAPKKHGEYYAWPAMFIGRTLETKAAKPWKQYGDTVELSVRGRVGRYVGNSNLQLVLIGQDELHSALNERYDGTARNPDRSARKDRARRVIRDINQLIRTLQREESTNTLALELSESPELLDASLNPDNPSWLGRLATSVADGSFELPKEPVMQLWTPATFPVGVQEGFGESGLGLTLRDSFMYTTRSHLIGELCSSEGLGLNRAHFSHDRGAVVQLVDTAPLPAAGLVYELPSKGQPVEFGAQAPHAYLFNNM